MEHVPQLIRYIPLTLPDEPLDGDRVAGWYLRVRRTRPGPGVAVCTVTGEVDRGNAALLEGAVRNAGRGAVAALVVDLSQVRFLGVAGVRVLHAAAARAAARGQWFAVVANTYSVRRVLDLGDVQQRITRYPRLSDALVAARRSSGASG